MADYKKTKVLAKKKKRKAASKTTKKKALAKASTTVVKKVKKPAKKSAAAKKPVKKPAKKPAVVKKKPAAKVTRVVFPKVTKAEALRQARTELARREERNARRREIRAAAKAAKEKAARKRAAQARKRRVLKAAEARLETKISAIETERQKRRTIKGDKREVEREIKRRKKAVQAETKKASEKAKPKPTTAALKKLTKAQLKDIAIERQRLQFLKTIEEAKGALPKPKKKRRKVVFDNGSGGYEVDADVQLEITPESIEEIYYRIDQVGKKLEDDAKGKLFPLWLATIFFSAMGEEIVGSPKLAIGDRPAITQTVDQSFQTIGVDNSGVWRTRQGMMTGVRVILEELITARYRNTIIYCHYAVIRNYRLGSNRP